MHCYLFDAELISANGDFVSKRFQVWGDDQNIARNKLETYLGSEAMVMIVGPLGRIEHKPTDALLLIAEVPRNPGIAIADHDRP